MLDAGVTAYASGDASSAGFAYSFLSSAGDWEFVGTGVTLSGGLPTGGIVTALQIDLGNNNHASPEIVITNLEDLFTGTQGFNLTSFSIGAGNAATQNSAFWGAALGEMDTFYFNLANYSIDLQIFGDGVIGDGQPGSVDGFGAGAAPLVGDTLIVGDFFDTGPNPAFTNRDYFTIVGAITIGDYYFVTGPAPFVPDVGNGDIFLPSFIADNSTGSVRIVGDAAFVSGVLFSDSDLIDLTATDISGLVTNTLILIGDTISVSGIAVGGNDTILGSSAAEIIYGDDANNSVAMLGGADSLNGGAGDDTIYGGDGIDRIAGGPGADYLDGQAGFDIAYYFESSGGVFVDLLSGTASFSDAEGDTLVGFFDIYGSNFSDTLIGDNDQFGNYLAGFDGDDILVGNDGADTLIGGIGSDTIDGGNGNDFLQGGFLGAESDSLFGGDGSDTLLGANGDDFVDGGNGDDSIFGDNGADFLSGGVGNDTLDYSRATFTGVFVDLENNLASGGDAIGDTISGFENVFGSDFNDTLLGDANGNCILCGFGDDSAFGAAGDDTITAYNGFCTLDGDEGDDVVIGGDGDDLLTSGLGSDKVMGGLGNDTLRGGEEANGSLDTLDGGFGADVFEIANLSGAIISYASTSIWVKIDLEAKTAYGSFAQGDVFVNDVAFLEASQGNDIVRGNSLANGFWGLGGNDYLSGRDGDDTLSGGSGNDTLRGDDGNDQLFSGLGKDRVDGGNGDDFIRTSNGNDTLLGGAGVDTLGGGSGGDLLNGNAGADLILASNGNDRLLGGDDNDTMLGGGGRDTLTGGAGDDRLVGGSQNDRFNFAPGSGADLIVDFAGGAGPGDVIGLIGWGAAFDDFTDVLAAASQVGNNVVIDLGGGDSITLQGVTLAALNADDFAFG